MGPLRGFFTGEDERLILSAIKELESRTSGEIRVRLEKRAGKDPIKAARRAFETLGMRNTQLRNGVLFLLAVEDRKFVILGDDGINQKVPEGFWNSVRDIVQGHFRNGLFAKGLAEGIKQAGEQLATFFPHLERDMNELPNPISYADEGGNR